MIVQHLPNQIQLPDAMFGEWHVTDQSRVVQSWRTRQKSKGYAYNITTTVVAVFCTYSIDTVVLNMLIDTMILWYTLPLQSAHVSSRSIDAASRWMSERRASQRGLRQVRWLFRPPQGDDDVPFSVACTPTVHTRYKDMLAESRTSERHEAQPDKLSCHGYTLPTLVEFCTIDMILFLYKYNYYCCCHTLITRTTPRPLLGARGRC